MAQQLDRTGVSKQAKSTLLSLDSIQSSFVLLSVSPLPSNHPFPRLPGFHKRHTTDSDASLSQSDVPHRTGPKLVSHAPNARLSPNIDLPKRPSSSHSLRGRSCTSYTGPFESCGSCGGFPAPRSPSRRNRPSCAVFSNQARTCLQLKARERTPRPASSSLVYGRAPILRYTRSRSSICSRVLRWARGLRLAPVGRLL